MFAELAAIDTALEFFTRHPPSTDVVILSDSLSALHFLKRLPASSAQRYFLCRVEEIMRLSGRRIFLTWIPGHSGLVLNEEADRLAKLARRSALDAARFPSCVCLPPLFAPVFAESSSLASQLST